MSDLRAKVITLMHNLCLPFGAVALLLTSRVLAEPTRDEVAPYDPMTRLWTTLICMAIAAAYYGTIRWKWLKTNPNSDTFHQFCDSLKHAALAAGITVPILLLGAELFEHMDLATSSFTFSTSRSIARPFISFSILLVSILPIYAALKALLDQTTPTAQPLHRDINPDWPDQEHRGNPL